jgi:hypothetical protein
MHDTRNQACCTETGGSCALHSAGNTGASQVSSRNLAMTRHTFSEPGELMSKTSRWPAAAGGPVPPVPAFSRPPFLTTLQDKPHGSDSLSSYTAVDPEIVARTIGPFLLTYPLIFCGMAMVPAWDSLQLGGWPPGVYQAIMAICGAGCGFLLAESDHRLPGLAGGALAGLGSLYAIVFHLEQTISTSVVIFSVMTLIGSISGFALYLVLRRVENSLWPTDPG